MEPGQWERQILSNPVESAKKIDLEMVDDIVTHLEAQESAESAD